MPESDPSPLVQDLLDAAQQEDTAAMETAAAQIRAANETETAVTYLGAFLLDKNEETAARRRVVQALTQLVSPTAAPLLGQALTQDEDAGVRRLCIAALERIDPNAGAFYFQQALTDSDKSVREAALTALGVATQQIVAVLQRQVTDEAGDDALAALRQIAPENLEKLLRISVSADADNVAIPEAAATALGLRGGETAVTILCRFLRDWQQKTAAEEQSSLGDADAERKQEAAEERVMMSAVDALREIGRPQTIPCLTDVLRHNLNYRVRRAAASALGRRAEPEAAAALIYTLLNDNDPRVRTVAHKRLAENSDWEMKTRKLLEILRSGGQTRADIDAPGLISAVKPPAAEMEENPRLLTDFLITQAAGVQDERMTALLAGLIIASANSSATLAAERINAVQEGNPQLADSLRPLRVEVGGSKALDPILSQLEENLKTNFQEPINALNERTSKVWRQTIQIAQLGFGLRAAMSVSLFLIGAYLVLDSYWLFRTGKLDQTNFFGPGVSFVAGLGTMLTMIFTGPLKEIRQAVGDVGIASAIFIAYIHRILQISHTFSYYYLDRKIDFAELQKAGDLIEDTMRDAIEMLRDPDRVTDSRHESE